MRHHYSAAAFLLAAATAVLSGAPGAARADVTIEEQTSFDLAIIKTHGTATEYTSTDKQRRDSDLHCEGFMSLLCGNSQSGEIIRLDKDLTWSLDPKKKAYRETHFLTAAERAAAEQQAQAVMAKMKQCPAMQNTSSGPDTSKCQMSPPKIDVKQIGTHVTLAGHDTQLTQVALTNSCTNKETGDVCDFVFQLDSWLTQDQIQGLDDQKAFRAAHLKKLGLDADNPLLQQQMKQFLTQYGEQMKQLSSKAGELKGYPLKTTMRILYGGEHCAAAKQQAQQSGGSGSAVTDAGQAAGTAASSAAAGAAGSVAGAAASQTAGSGAAGSVLGSAASAFSSKLVSGLFAKKKQENTATTPAAANASGNSTLPPGTVQFATMTIETTSVTTGAIPDTRFEIPPGWKLIPPNPPKEEKEFTCPKADGA